MVLNLPPRSLQTTRGITVDTAILSSVIGAVGVGLFAMFFALWSNQRTDFGTLSDKFDTLSDKFDEHRRETRGMIDGHQRETRGMFDEHRRETREMFDGHRRETRKMIDEHRRETREQLNRLSDENKEILRQMNQGFRIQGERLARIEHELKIEPPPEAA